MQNLVHQAVEGPISSELLGWFLFAVLNLGLIVLVLYQERSLTDLENDHLNSYDAARRLNSTIIPEFLCHAAFCILLLLFGYWFFFLVALLPAFFNLHRYKNGGCRTFATEIILNLKTEKQQRRTKLLFYSVLELFLVFGLIQCFHKSKELVTPIML